MSQFEEYKKKVMESYESRRTAGELATSLMNPTPANLRNECLLVYSESPTDKDLKILRDFFGPQGSNADYYQIIWNAKTDKFKPLANFLKKPSINTNKKNIELLAWLIDHQPRPFRFNYHPDDNQAERIAENPQKPSERGRPSIDDGDKDPDAPPTTAPDVSDVEGGETAVLPKKRGYFGSKVIVLIIFAFAGYFGGMGSSPLLVVTTG